MFLLFIRVYFLDIYNILIIFTTGWEHKYANTDIELILPNGQIVFSIETLYVRSATDLSDEVCIISSSTGLYNIDLSVETAHFLFARHDYFFPHRVSMG
jgi:hypothetical protein